MPTPALINDPAHWRQRAQEMRSIANRFDDPVAKQSMLEIAQYYEQLAAIAEQRPLAKP
jgi:hypothetical protein